MLLLLHLVGCLYYYINKKPVRRGIYLCCRAVVKRAVKVLATKFLRIYLLGSRLLVSKYVIKLVVPPALISKPNGLPGVQRDNVKATFTFFLVCVHVRTENMVGSVSH